MPNDGTGAAVGSVSVGELSLLARYGAVSVFNIGVHQLILLLANSFWGWPGGWANAFAASLVVIPAYLLSRHFVWKVQGEHSWRREILPFWIISAAGLVVSTGFAASAQAAFGSGVAVNAASFVGYLIVWVAKFFLIGRIFQ